jgi:hypothetical protein
MQRQYCSKYFWSSSLVQKWKISHLMMNFLISAGGNNIGLTTLTSISWFATGVIAMPVIFSGDSSRISFINCCIIIVTLPLDKNPRLSQDTHVYGLLWLKMVPSFQRIRRVNLPLMLQLLHTFAKSSDCKHARLLCTGIFWFLCYTPTIWVDKNTIY